VHVAKNTPAVLRLFGWPILATLDGYRPGSWLRSGRYSAASVIRRAVLSRMVLKIGSAASLPRVSVTTSSGDFGNGVKSAQFFRPLSRTKTGPSPPFTNCSQPEVFGQFGCLLSTSLIFLIAAMKSGAVPGRSTYTVTKVSGIGG
jgi:hypothetical protein